LVSTSLADGILVTINLSDTIGHGKQVPKSEKRDDSNCFWLDPEWAENTEALRAKEIIPFFVGAASEAGFRIAGCWTHKYNAIVFQCIRAKRNDQHKNKAVSLRRRQMMKLKKPSVPPIERNRKTQRPLKLNEEELLNHLEFEEEATAADIETCKHKFHVYWDDDRSRWFIPQKQAGCRRHKGHPHIGHPLLRIQPRHAVPANEIDVTETALDSKIGVSQAAGLVLTRTGLHLDWHQVHYLNMKQKDARLGSDTYATAADKLAATLSQPDISSVSLFADYNTSLLTIKQKKVI